LRPRTVAHGAAVRDKLEQNLSVGQKFGSAISSFVALQISHLKLL